MKLLQTLKQFIPQAQHEPKRTPRSMEEINQTRIEVETVWKDVSLTFVEMTETDPSILHYDCLELSISTEDFFDSDNSVFRKALTAISEKYDVPLKVNETEEFIHYPTIQLVVEYFWSWKHNNQAAFENLYERWNEKR